MVEDIRYLITGLTVAKAGDKAIALHVDVCNPCCKVSGDDAEDLTQT